MKLLLQLFYIFTLCLIGEGISSALPFPFPSSIISMLLLLILLCTKWIRASDIKELSEFLLSNMAFFFIPAGVAVMEKYNLLKGNILILLLICILTTVLTFLATSYTVTLIMKVMNQKGGSHE